MNKIRTKFEKNYKDWKNRYASEVSSNYFNLPWFFYQNSKNNSVMHWQISKGVKKDATFLTHFNASVRPLQMYLNKNIYSCAVQTVLEYQMSLFLYYRANFVVLSTELLNYKNKLPHLLIRSIIQTVKYTVLSRSHLCCGWLEVVLVLYNLFQQASWDYQTNILDLY